MQLQIIDYLLMSTPSALILSLVSVLCVLTIVPRIQAAAWTSIRKAMVMTVGPRMPQNKQVHEVAESQVLSQPYT